MKILINPLLLSICLLFTFFSNASTQSETKVNFINVNSSEEWETILDKANLSGRLIFVDVYTDWCGYCKMMDKDVFSDSEVAGYLNDNFVSVKLDAETEFGASFTQTYQIEGYPTYVFLDKDENLTGSIGGYNKKEPFLNQSKTIQDKSDLLPELKKKYEKGELTQEETAQFAVLIKDSNSDLAKVVAEELMLKLDAKDFKNSEYAEFFKVFAANTETEFFDYVKNNKEEFKANAGDENFSGYLENVYNATLAAAIMENDINKLSVVTEEVLPIYIENSSELPQAKFVTEKLYYGNVQDAEGYAAVVQKYYASTGKNEEDFWYNQSYEIVEDFATVSSLIDLSITWLDNLVKSEEDYETYALYAYTQGIKGDYEDAKLKAEKAKSLARNEEQKQMADDLLEMISEAASGN
ncbi:MAG: hypothetical protein CMO01_24920 [Thalassobius sp.]|nr:hypothetical protein [Thalassovita sp.]